MGRIIVLGLGAGDYHQLPLGIYKRLKESQLVFLRTKEHPVVADLVEEGFTFTSFDDIYEKHDHFDAVYEEISETLLNLASNQQEIIYAVPGHPLVAEKTVQILLEDGPKAGISIEIGGGQSFIDAMFQALKIDPIDGFQLLDGTSLNGSDLHLSQHMIIGQVYDSFVASDVKLTLMEKLPYDYEVYIVSAAGSEAENITKLPLFELDHELELSNLTSLYIPPITDEQLAYKEFYKLREIIAELRGPNGCPWDKKQTHRSLKKYLIEEAYELIEAIQNDDVDHMIEELGDVLLQVMLHAQIGEDEGFFTIEDVIQGLSEKMVRRHPHVFGERVADTEEDVLKNWQEIKGLEKGEARGSLLNGINKELPQLLQAFDIQKKAATVGFDWQEISSAWEKVKEELLEFEEELAKKGEHQDSLGEFGDILFAFVNIARYYRINPEEAIFQTNQKFKRRFQYIEEKVHESGREFSAFSLEELDGFWNEAKKLGL
ncbi:nucleoside triphosphate pyrophosphohydrolase [Cytobacillus spongiae]|uniref:nucleoside triphosphate pyrophosphohydrolase n=1 Tax=Cytobacillus spongiae TaxID=2901381 RepID=UPI001F30F46E|nr:nucleoside triphosphate pyrophosphohydrolase [Cytobacillus spongiae]UII56016.1 nucleoside triphosphate pyrophosphohydrolase [Cytobacillus spongiae]